MSDSRTTHGLGQHPGALFRCVVCQRFVKATERGVCPTCGFKPPTLTRSGKPDRLIWNRAVRKARAYNESRPVSRLWPWLIAVAVAIAIASASY